MLLDTWVWLKMGDTPKMSEWEHEAKLWGPYIQATSDCSLGNPTSGWEGWKQTPGEKWHLWTEALPRWYRYMGIWPVKSWKSLYTSYSDTGDLQDQHVPTQSNKETRNFEFDQPDKKKMDVAGKSWIKVRVFKVLVLMWHYIMCPP
jgi:hypothetical protein